ncbi:MFS transporter [Devosia nitrariae]|uniref:MFS transporter n=1 Tax=Devosia nitrariae TaxID=2071872 RepID=A0ABQ5WA61_9HYPH|nr:MFS transporter [Devosia nitrariae]GLQ56994.1 MFS transporter [Devosia nitrariae]
MSTIETVVTTCKRGLVLAPVAALLLSVALLLLGNGLLGTLLVVRAGNEGFANETIGAMMSAYFAGYAIGAWFLPQVVISVGHVRTFAGFAAVASMTAILHLASIDPWSWTLLRAVTGLAYAGMILATESWLNAHAVQSTRGQLLSIFGVVSMGAWALGQALLNVASPDGIVLFLVVSLLITASVVPITLLPSRPPADVAQEPFSLRQLLAISPLATAGVFLAGLAIGAFWGMGPNFAQRIGLDVGGTSAFMAAVLGGTLVLQWPLGWVSDRLPRNMVIAAAAIGAGAAAIALAVATQAPLPVLLVIGALFGGLGIPIYSLCAAFANDGLSQGQMLGAARGLLLLNDLGTAVGPLVGGLAMTAAGPGGLFVYASVLLGVLAVAALPNMRIGRSGEAVSTRCPHTPLITLSLNALLQGQDAPQKAKQSQPASSGSS